MADVRAVARRMQARPAGRVEAAAANHPALLQVVVLPLAEFLLRGLRLATLLLVRTTPALLDPGPSALPIRQGAVAVERQGGGQRPGHADLVRAVVLVLSGRPDRFNRQVIRQRLGGEEEVVVAGGAIEGLMLHALLVAHHCAGRALALVLHALPRVAMVHGRRPARLAPCRAVVKPVIDVVAGVARLAGHGQVVPTILPGIGLAIRAQANVRLAQDCNLRVVRVRHFDELDVVALQALGARLLAIDSAELALRRGAILARADVLFALLGFLVQCEAVVALLADVRPRVGASVAHRGNAIVARAALGNALPVVQVEARQAGLATDAVVRLAFRTGEGGAIGAKALLVAAGSVPAQVEVLDLRVAVRANLAAVLGAEFAEGGDAIGALALVGDATFVRVEVVASRAVQALVGPVCGAVGALDLFLAGAVALALANIHLADPVLVEVEARVARVADDALVHAARLVGRGLAVRARAQVQHAGPGLLDRVLEEVEAHVAVRAPLVAVPRASASLGPGAVPRAEALLLFAVGAARNDVAPVGVALPAHLAAHGRALGAVRLGHTVVARARRDDGLLHHDGLHEGLEAALGAGVLRAVLVHQFGILHQRPVDGLLEQVFLFRLVSAQVLGALRRHAAVGDRGRGNGRDNGHLLRLLQVLKDLLPVLGRACIQLEPDDEAGILLHEACAAVPEALVHGVAVRLPHVQARLLEAMVSDPRALPFCLSGARAVLEVLLVQAERRLLLHHALLAFPLAVAGGAALRLVA
mmetsp:Transcript_299/g.1056  ORF Transcript_299/g.1056 Transcript_299/m.1056 type:complete len:760 (+) Transcript_299:475-2754(+)